MEKHQHTHKSSDDNKTAGIIGFDGEPAAVRRTVEAMKAELAQRDRSVAVTFDELHELATRHAAANGVEVKVDVRLWQLPEPWSSYLGRRHYPRYVAGHVGDRPVIGTATWLLDCPEEIVEAALAAGFTSIRVDADAFGTPTGEPVALELPPGDDPIVKVGESSFSRDLLELLVERGATSGHVQGRVKPLIVPSIGVVMPLDIASPPSALERIAAHLADALIQAGERGELGTPRGVIGEGSLEDVADTIEAAADLAAAALAAVVEGSPFVASPEPTASVRHALAMLSDAYGQSGLSRAHGGLDAFCRAVAVALRSRAAASKAVLH